jgi:hypothetical protein
MALCFVYRWNSQAYSLAWSLLIKAAQGKFDLAAPEDSARRNSLGGGKLPAFEEMP